MPKFYELTPHQRRAALVAAGRLTTAEAESLANGGGLDPAQADALVENQIGQFSLPLGVVERIVVNGQARTVPMVTEEPSVIAAANNGARMAGEAGFTVTSAPHRVSGEVVFDDLADLPAAAALVRDRIPDLMTVAAHAHASIVRRGGGVRAIAVDTVAKRWLKLTVTVDPQAAMGANIVNTILEAIGATVGKWLQVPPLAAILSNRSEALTAATATLPVTAVATGTQSGGEIAGRIAAISDLAEVDRDRAVTHNKGIMNGINAVVLASGNDTRAVAAAVHAYAGAEAGYRPLATWRVAGDQLVGTLRLPLPVGIVGGAMSALPVAQLSRRLGEYQSVAALQAEIAAIGLAQNLAALRALVGPGLQAGHMALQANALAIAAGAVGAEIKAVATRMQTRDLAGATAALAALRTERKNK